jgi:catechol 2,3-dioxygenase-like lactoylglutathione lyase family enzyme
MPDVDFIASSETAAAPGPRPEPALKLKFFSHATIDVADIDRARKFYEEFTGFEVVQTSKISLLVRIGGKTSIAVVRTKHPLKMDLMNRNGIDVTTKIADRELTPWAGIALETTTSEKRVVIETKQTANLRETAHARNEQTGRKKQSR